MSSHHGTVGAETIYHHTSYFFLATEVEHLVVNKWTGDAIIDFAIVVASAAFLSFLWQGLGRMSRMLQRKLDYYARLELELVSRDRRHRYHSGQLHHRGGGMGGGPDSPSKRPAYLYHNGHVFHQTTDYMELLDAHQERQMTLDGSTSAQLQRQQQRNASLLEGATTSSSPSHLALDEGEEDVFLEPDPDRQHTDQHHATVLTDLTELGADSTVRSLSSSSRQERSLSIDLGPNRWNSLHRSKRGYIGNYSRVGLKCYRFLYHCILAVNHTLKLAIGYVLMLVVMTYNAWFLVAVLGGAALGYFLFAADLQTAAMRTESAIVSRRMRRRRLENIRPQTFQPIH
ncbi:uncharacterized protein [Diadema setosum]|uniref:uncharacterized protein n=1 Tax=Diadema setosum TaxID=31175 RepID=UPI003B3BB1F0